MIFFHWIHEHHRSLASLSWTFSFLLCFLLFEFYILLKQKTEEIQESANIETKGGNQKQANVSLFIQFGKCSAFRRARWGDLFKVKALFKHFSCDSFLFCFDFKVMDDFIWHLVTIPECFLRKKIIGCFQAFVAGLNPPAPVSVLDLVLAMLTTAHKGLLPSHWPPKKLSYFKLKDEMFVVRNKIVGGNENRPKEPTSWLHTSHNFCRNWFYFLTKLLLIVIIFFRSFFLHFYSSNCNNFFNNQSSHLMFHRQLSFS